MSRIVYDTATSVNGYIADEDNSLAWLFAVPHDDATMARLAPPDSPVIVMGSSTYEWLLKQEALLRHPEKWQRFYPGKAVFVFTTRELPVPVGAEVTFLSGPVADHLECLRAGGDIWVIGGGDLAGQFLDADALDEIRLSIAPAFLTGGAALLPRNLCCDRVQLVTAEAFGAFARLVYRVIRDESRVRLTSMTIESVDGVIQGNGGPDEDRRGGFERGGWAMGNPDPEARSFIGQFYERADAFLFGRWTFELFGGYWGTMPAGSHPIADALNSRRKYVVSSTLIEPSWPGSSVLPCDPAAIEALKATPGGEVQVHGSGTLLRWLLAQALVDELTLLTVPVVVGQGARLFPDNGPNIDLDLVHHHAFPKGATVRVYRPRR